MSHVRVTAVASSVVALAVLPVFLTGAMGVQIRAELGIGTAGFGLMLSAFYISSALSSPRLGRAVERHKPVKSMRWAVTLTFVSLIGVGLAGRNPGLYAGFLVLTGLGFALAQLATDLFIARAIPTDKRATALGIKHAAIPFATLLAGLTVPAIAVTIGWRWAFLVGAGGATILWAGLPKSLSGSSGPASVDQKRSSSKELVALAVAISIATAGGSALGAFLVSYAVATGMGHAAAGLLLAAGGASSIAVRVISGWVADRRSSHGYIGVVMLLMFGSVGYALLITEQPMLILVGTIIAFGGVLGWSGLVAHAVIDRNLDAPAGATGVTQVGFYAGGVIGPPFFGLLIDQFSYRFAWAVGAGTALLAAGLVLVIELTRRASRS